ncbi:MAG: hypothetical protein R3E08_11060 [Thiotrichaceae bacterium]
MPLQFVPPAPPKQFRIATGSTANSLLRFFGSEYKKDIDKQGFKLELQPTSGSIEALTLLKAGKVDLGLSPRWRAKICP